MAGVKRHTGPGSPGRYLQLNTMVLAGRSMSLRAFRDKNIAEAPTVANQHAKLAPVPVDITPRPFFKFERFLVDEFKHSVRSAVARASSDEHLGSLTSGVSISAIRIF